MSWSLNIGSVAGTAVRVHVTFLLFLAWIFGVNYFSGGAQAAWSGLLFIVLLFLCVLLHEFGHIFTARAFGVRTPDVILLPIGGVARLERIPERPSQEFLIAIAGPAVNIVIALILILLDSAHPSADRLAALESANVSMIDRLAAVNLFNGSVRPGGARLAKLGPFFEQQGLGVAANPVKRLATRRGVVPVKTRAGENNLSRT